MVLKKTITDDEMLDIAAKVINERFIGLTKNDICTMGLYMAAVAAEIFADGEEVLSTKVTDQYIIGDYKYYVTTGGDVGAEYRIIIRKDDDVIARFTLPTEEQALKYIIKHMANHKRTTI